MDVASVATLALLGLFLALQPWSVLAAILLATARDGLRKESAFVAGWVTVLVVVSGATVLVYPSISHTSTTSRVQGGVELAAGVVLGGWLLWRWRHPKDAGTAGQPSWMRRLDTMSPVLAFGLGAFLPTYAVVVAAVSEMTSSGLTRWWLVAVALTWVLLASTGVASPLLVRLRDGDDAPQTYQSWRSWILSNSRAVLLCAGGLVCVVLDVKGILALLG